MGFYDQPGRDGRRRSDPLRQLSTNPAMAPEWQLVRIVTADDDATSKGDRSNGVNFGNYRFGHFQIVPLATNDLVTPVAGTADPAVELLVWCPILGAFISTSTKLEFAGLGAGVPFRISANVEGQIIMPSITSTESAPEVVAIYASGFNVQSTF
jgi:hypothetical protein